MSVAIIFSVVLSSGLASVPLKEINASGMTLSVPAEWKKTLKGQTYQFEAPEEDAAFEMTIMPVEPKRSARECVTQLRKALGAKWQSAQTGGHPAAKKTSSERTKKVSTQTIQFVGCNGSVKWIQSWTFVSERRQVYTPLAQSVFQSIRYEE